MNTAVALFVYNRPGTTARVFEAIRRARPPRLLVVADGPRADRPGDAALCAHARGLTEQIDWPCRVERTYAAHNLGCRPRLSSGLDWVFAAAEEAIVLEDDCLPDMTFFRFCEELLARYRDDEQVMHIGGSNSQPRRFATPYSYYFSRYPHVWGWASWRRAWRHYDVGMAAWAGDTQKALWLGQFETRAERTFWRQIWDAVQAGQIDTWDYQWVFACLQQGGLAAVPAVNLVTNIGFGPDSTHTGTADARRAPAATALAFPLSHPATKERDAQADDRVRKLFFSRPSVAQRVMASVKHRLKDGLA